jgi:23S rRNA pseudouridine1911/1915/1917 synthase
MAESRLVTTDRGDAGQRLDLVLRRHLKDVRAATRTRIQVWIEGGQVLVNGLAVRRPSARAGVGDVLAVALPDAPPRPAMTPEAIALDVLYEDDYLLAVNKPAGIVVHPTYRHAAGTLLNALLWRARDWPLGQRPSIVGRLDKLTSGIVVVARTRAVHAALQTALASNRSEKDYLAVTYGQVQPTRGTIDFKLARDPRDRRRVVASTTIGAPSLTLFERLATVRAPAAGLSLVRCRLTTGRMHQIRVHLAASGWPLVGDSKYGETRWKNVVDLDLASTLAAFPRQALHAWRVALRHPFSRVTLRLEAEVPQDFGLLLRLSNLHDLFERHHVRLK